MDEECRNILSVLDKRRGRFRRPIYITKTFQDVMDRSDGTFNHLHKTIIQECDGECGIMYYPPLAAKNGCLAYVIESGVIMVAIFVSRKNENDSVLFDYCIITVEDEKKGNDHSFSYMGRSALQRLHTHDTIRRQYNFYAYEVLTYLGLRKYADVEIKAVAPNAKTIIGNEKCKNTGRIPYDIFDCKWFTEICRDEDFKVRGHFRLQPYKNGGVWAKKLIYINEFTKHGYHRKAGIQKTNQ